MVSIQKKLLLVVLVTLILGGSLLLFRHLSSEPEPPQNIVIKMWKRDLRQLDDKLPESWRNVAEVDLNFGDEQTKAFFSNLKAIPLKINAAGDFRLAVTVITAEQELFIFQHNMIHIPSGEMIWELARTYRLKEGAKSLASDL